MDSNINKVLFTTQDPLGRQIVLKHSTWETHIKYRHSEKDIDSIKDNVTNPNIILENTKETNSDKNREVYYRYIIYDNKLINQKTVVEFDEDGNGEVVTNYLLRKINESVLEGGIKYDCTSTMYTK